MRQKSKDYTFIEKCYHCQELDYISFNDQVTLGDKLSSKYAASAMTFGHKATELNFNVLKQQTQPHETDIDQNDESFLLDEQFVRRFADLKMLGLINTPYMEDEKLPNHHQQLIRIDLQNNRLTRMPRLVGK